MNPELKKKLLNISEDSVVTTTFASKFKEKNLDDIVFFTDRLEPSTRIINAALVTGSLRITGNILGFGYNVIDRLAKDAISKPLAILRINQPDPDIGGMQRLNGTTTDFTSDDDNIKEFRFGKDVKNVKHFFRETLSPFVSLGNDDKFFNQNEQISHIYQTVNFGQNSLFKTYDREKQKNIPFVDHDGVFKPENFLTNPELIFEGPNLFNGEKSLDQFRDPDNESIDGAYDVLGYRSTYINTSFSDLQIKGAKGLFGVGDWKTSTHNMHMPKGSSIITDVFSNKQSNSDYFDDAQDNIFSEPGIEKASFREGYVSDFTVSFSSFEDIDHYFLDQKYYSHVIESLGIDIRNNLFSGSLNKISEIGTRFKASTRGFISTPVFSNIEQIINGTDSLSFAGLLKE